MDAIMEPCNRCEVLPEALPVAGTLYLSPPMQPTRTKIEARLSEMGLHFSAPYPNVMEIPFRESQLLELCQGHLPSLGRLELNDTKCLVIAHGVTPGVRELMTVQPLAGLVARVQGTRLLELLRSHNLVVHFQPIVECGEPDKVFAFECLLRGDEGREELIPPEEMFRWAKSADLLFYLDQSARDLAIREAARHKLEALVFVNFIPTSIYSPSHCLSTTLEAVHAGGLPPEQIVFEVVESEKVDDTAHLVEILRYYRENGFRVALDDLGAGYGCLNLLHDLKPDFVKLDVGLIRGVDRDPYKAKISANLLELARELRIPAIAEGVETEAEWRWLRAQGADYVQGYLFARPASPPESPMVDGRDAVGAPSGR